MATPIQLRRGAASAWTAADPVLRAGEAGVELDTGPLVKVGDGVRAWTDLPYLGNPDLSGYVLTADARLSDARVPLAHTHLFADLTISKADLGLGLVEDTALSTWAGSANLTTLGTIASLSATKASLGDGTGALPSLTFASMPTYGLFGVPAAGVIGVALNAIQKLRFDASSTYYGITFVSGAALMWHSGTTFGAGASALDLALTRPGAGQLNIERSAAIGVGLDVATDGTLKIRTRAQTGPAALWMGVNAIAAVSTDGLLVANDTAATVGVPVQQSPRLRFRSNVWNTTTPANNTDDWFIESVPVNGATPSGLLKFGKQLNGGAVTFPMTLSSAGKLDVLTVDSSSGTLTLGGTANVTVNGSVTAANQFAGSTGAVGVSSRYRITGPADGQLNLQNYGLTAGVGFDVATDGTLKIRTRAQTGDASLTALNITASGTVVAALVAASLAPAAAGYLQWTGRATVLSPADAQLTLANNAQNSGVGLDLATDATLKVRVRAQNAYATVDALAYRASGVAGISFGPAHPASITIVNGIVTACS